MQGRKPNYIPIKQNPPKEKKLKLSDVFENPSKKVNKSKNKTNKGKKD